MAIKYVTRDDVHRYLDRTICTYDGVPYFVITSGYANDDVALCNMVGPYTKINKVVKYTDEKFVDRAIPLGYINLDTNTHYLSRVPHRRQNQSFNQSCIISTPMIKNEYWFVSHEFNEALQNKYPSKSVAQAMIATGGYQGMAIHRHIAFQKIDQKILGLFYKTKLVATQRDGEWIYQPGDDIAIIKKIIERIGCLT